LPPLRYARDGVALTARRIVPVAMLLVALIGLFVAAESGQQRVAEASRQVEIGAFRHRILSELFQLVIQAESGQRGFVLLGDPTYLTPYEEAIPKVGATLHRLDEAFATADPRGRADISDVERLTKLKMDELAESLELYRRGGQKAALVLIRTDAGKETEQTNEIVASSRSWRDELWATRWITGGGLVLNIFLVLLVRRLVVRDLQNRERDAEELAARGSQLELEVKRRTEDLSDLSTHLQTIAEEEKASLSRELHDELGGLLVAARMDVSWLEGRVGGADPEVESHFRRLHEALAAGVDVKRRVIESLRPTLLDNLGLFPALRWQLAESCGRAGLACVERYPANEPQLTPEASIAVFRIVQESLTNILKHAQARNVEVSVDVEGAWLVVRIRDDGIGLPPDRLQAIGSHGLAAMRHRSAGFGGRWTAARRRDGGTEIEISLPLERVSAPPAA
jgi:signal transduction histidine kinase